MTGSGDKCGKNMDGQKNGWAKRCGEDNLKEQALCRGTIFLPAHFFAKSIPVARFGWVTDEMFVSGWNL